MRPGASRSGQATVITRRTVLLYLPLGSCLGPIALAGTKPKVIGILNPYFPANVKASLDRFDLEMRQLGYVKGTDYVIVERMAEGHNEQLRSLVEELVRQRVDLIFATPTNAVAEAQRATSSIPIIFLSVADPVGSGFATSLARPGHNLTGVTNFAGDLQGKRLELLKQTIPGLKRIAILVTAKSPNYSTFLPQLQEDAKVLGLTTTIVEAQLPLDLEAAFKAIVASKSQAIYVWGDPYLWTAAKQVADLSLRARLPTIFLFVEHVEAGGLMSYGADTQDWMRQSAAFADKIFRGAKPGDLPIEQPMKFDLAINRKTADALELKIPQAIWLQATRVIE